MSAPGPPAAGAQPTSPVAVRVVEAVYLFGLLLGITGLAAFVFRLRMPIAVDPQLFLLVTIGLFGLLFLLLRRGAVERWFVLHLLWLVKTYASLFVAWVVGVFLMFCAMFLGGWLLAVGLGIWGAAGLWFLVRHVRGYLAFRRREPIGG